MARLSVWIVGVLLAASLWLWISMDLVSIAPAHAAASEREPTGQPEAAAATVATGEQVAHPNGREVILQDSAGERTAVAPAQTRYTICGRVTRGGAAQAGREVLCSSGWGAVPLKTVSGRDGGFSFVVPPGAYELYAPHMVGTTRQQPAFRRGPPSGRSRLAAKIVTCEVQNEDVELVMRLSTRSLVVTVRNAKTHAPIPKATVTWRPPIPEQDELLIEADANGRLRIPDVTAGNSELLVSARAFVGSRRDVRVVADEADQVVDFLLQPACAVDVVMVDEQRQAIPVSRAQVLALHPVVSSEDRVRDPIHPSNRKHFLRKERPLRTPFDGLPAGQYRVHFDGDFYGLAGEQPTVRFAPCVAQQNHVIDVRPGVVQRCEVPVARRSYATLRATNEQGELLNGSLQLTFQGSDGVLRRVMPAPWQHGNRHAGSHFDGYLKPGAYRLAFSMGGRVWREQLVVTALVVDRTLRLPW